MSDLKQAVARAIKEARALPGTKPVAKLSDVDHRAAQAALTTIFDRLMEPSEGMIVAAITRPPAGDMYFSIWQAMLTKAKEEAGIESP